MMFLCQNRRTNREGREEREAKREVDGRSHKLYLVRLMTAVL